MKTFSRGTLFFGALLAFLLPVSCGGRSSSGGGTNPGPQPTLVAATPAFSPAAGTYTQAQNVTITSTTPNATIYYTLDGATPTSASSKYTTAIPVSTTTQVKAIATASGYTNSSVASATYTINPPSPSSSYTWKNVEVVAGGFITGIVFHPAQRDLIYTRTDIGGAYRWNAISKRWVPLTDWVGFDNWNLLGIESIGLDPSDPQRLYLAAGTYTRDWSSNGAILISTDQGNTFTTVPIPFKMGGNEDGRSTGERLSVDPNDGSIVYFGSRLNGLWKSTDHGAHWSKVSTFPVTAATNGAGVVFINFVKASGSQGLPTPVLYAGVSDTGTHLYRSTDAGATWTAVPGQPSSRGLYVNHGVFGPDGSLYLSYGNNIGPNGMTEGAIWKYTPESGNANAAGTWADITPTNLPYEGWMGTGYAHGWGCVAVDPQQPGVIMASTMDLWYQHDGIVRSLDGGNTWIDLGETSVRDASSAPYLNWGGAAPAVGNWLGSLAINPFDSDHVLYGTGATIWATNEVTKSEPGTPNPGFLVLRGGATNWTVGALGIEETAVLKLISPPAGAHLISALGDINGFVHDDFNRSPAGGMQTPLFTTTTGLDFAEKLPSLIVRVGSTYEDRTPFGAYSTDGGATWTGFASHPVTRSGGSIAVSADGTTFVWSAQDGSVYASSNKGATWTKATGAPQYKNIVADRVNSRKFYLLDDNAIYVSTDAGATFTRISHAGTWTGGSLVASPAGEGDLWVASDNGLYRSTDSGSTFTRFANVQVAYAIAFGKAGDGASYPTVYLAGKVNDTSAVYRSTDAGASWTRISDDQHQYGRFNVITGDPRVFGRVYLGTNGRGIIYGEPSN